VNDDNRSSSPLLVLLDLARRARRAANLDELAFLAVNDSRALAVYRQAALWFVEGSIRALSGIVQAEANAPYVHWLDRVGQHFCTHSGASIIPVSAADLPPADAEEWSEWLPQHGLWFPIPGKNDGQLMTGGLLFAAEEPWSETQIALLREWLDIWLHAWLARADQQRWSWPKIRQALVAWFAAPTNLPWWRRPRTRAITVTVAILLFPVHLTVLAPGELVPANPAIIRAPLDGVIGQFHVAPNEKVRAGQALFGFDESALAARHDVAAQTLATAETEYRQYAQQAVTDSKSKAQLAQTLGKIEERKAEAGFLGDQLERARVVAPVDGVALFDDPTEWIGKPVQTGERVMRIAAPGDVEVEAWVSLADAIPLADKANVTLYLSADPLNSISAELRYFSHDAVLRPNGIYAYRLRANIPGGTERRVGLKGTVKIQGDWVPFSYWVLRRPLATIRQTLGF